MNLKLPATTREASSCSSHYNIHTDDTAVSFLATVLFPADHFSCATTSKPNFASFRARDVYESCFIPQHWELRSMLSGFNFSLTWGQRKTSELTSLVYMRCGCTCFAQIKAYYHQPRNLKYKNSCDHYMRFTVEWPCPRMEMERNINFNWWL